MLVTLTFKNRVTFLLKPLLESNFGTIVLLKIVC